MKKTLAAIAAACFLAGCQVVDYSPLPPQARWRWDGDAIAYREAKQRDKWANEIRRDLESTDR